MDLSEVLSKPSTQLAVALLIPNVGSGLSQLIFKDKRDDWYAKLKKPCYNPPGYVFGPVWAGLYTGMGYASYLAYKNGGGFNGPARIPLLMYGGQLVYNFAWYRLFACYRSLKWVRNGIHIMTFAKFFRFKSTIGIVGLTAAAAATSYAFYTVDPVAGYLMAPYVCWLAFASLLTNSIYRINKDQKKEN